MAFDKITKLNGRYWEKRALKLEQLTQKKARETVKAVCRNYELAQHNIVKQIERIFSRYVNNNAALNEEKALQLLSEKQTAEYRQELLELYNQTDDPELRAEIRARLEAPAYANRISSLQALRDRLYLDCRMVGLSEVELVRDRLMDVLEQSYYRQTFDIQQGVGLHYDFSKLSNRQMQAIIAQKWEDGNYSSRIWKNNQGFARKVEQTVAVGILSGQSFRDMSDNLRHVVGEDDSEGAKYKAMRLIRTECDHIAVQGQMLGYQAAEIEYYTFIATLDLVTSDICRALDLQRFPVAEAKTGVNLPPMHPHCRSVTGPYIDEAVLAKTYRAARDPVTGKSITVPANMSYREWYQKYVVGNAAAEANEKKKKNASADKKQLERYRALLGDHAPKSLVSFQRMKYNEPEKWEQLKAEYRQANWQRKANHNVAKSPDSGIISSEANKERREVQEVISVQTIGRIDTEKYRVVSDKIRTDEVIITDERIAHIKERHPNDFERYSGYIEEMLINPQYILADPVPNTAVILQEFVEADERFRLILKLAVKEDAEHKKNSVITFLKISEKKFKKYLRNKEILYKSE